MIKMCIIYIRLSLFENKINKFILTFGIFTWLSKIEKHSASSILKINVKNGINVKKEWVKVKTPQVELIEVSPVGTQGLIGKDRGSSRQDTQLWGAWSPSRDVFSKNVTSFLAISVEIKI